MNDKRCAAFAGNLYGLGQLGVGRHLNGVVVLVQPLFTLVRETQ